MQKDGMVRYHGDKGVADPGGTAENKGVNQVKPCTGFPDKRKDKKNQNAGKGDGPQFPFPLFQEALLGKRGFSH